MVFDDELTILVDNLIQKDRKVYNIQINNSSMNFYKSRMRAVFLILLRYSGLRKNELRSRRLSDWYRTSDGYAIDVNKEGFKQMIRLLPEEENKGLKNRAARRRVTFSIDDPNLKKIVDKFYDICQDMNKKFVFLEVTEQTIYSRPTPSKTIDKLNSFMQETLNRKVVLHSLRHSFITYNIARILANNEDNTQKEVFELCNMTGQSDPTVMMNNYLHIDHLRHFIQQYKNNQVKN
jgi:integrase